MLLERILSSLMTSFEVDILSAVLTWEAVPHLWLLCTLTRDTARSAVE